MTLAFVFPGQGSQSIGMQAELAAGHPLIAETYAEASDVLGFDLWELVQNGPEQRLNETVNTQPAMLTAGVATWRLWREQNGADPAFMAGHSLGEYSALVAAGALRFDAAVQLVRRRAELMQQAVPADEGAMAAVLGLDDAAIVAVCKSASGDGVAEAVNFNSPGQVVVAGHRRAVERLIGMAEDAGARRAIMLPVSVPAHSSLLRPAGEALSRTLEATDFGVLKVPVVSAVDASEYRDAADIRLRLTKQLSSPVRWVDVINHCVTNGVTSIVECGPGRVLTGLSKRIDRNLHGICLDTMENLQKALNGAGA